MIIIRYKFLDFCFADLLSDDQNEEAWKKCNNTSNTKLVIVIKKVLFIKGTPTLAVSRVCFCLSQDSDRLENTNEIRWKFVGRNLIMFRSKEWEILF